MAIMIKLTDVDGVQIYLNASHIHTFEKWTGVGEHKGATGTVINYVHGTYVVMHTPEEVNQMIIDATRAVMH